jgi:integrase
MLSTNIRLNQQALFSSTISLKISDAQIKKHLRDPRVRQLKDVRCSLYLKFNKARTGGTWVLMEYKKGNQLGHRIGKYPATQAKHIMDLVSIASQRIAAGEKAECSGFETVDQLINWHVEREFKLHRSTTQRLQNLKSMAEQHVRCMFEGWPVMKLCHQTVDKQLIQPMFQQGYSLSYVRANFNLMKTAYSAAKKVKEITVNPMSDVRFKDFFGETFSISAGQVRGCRFNTDQLPETLMATQKADPDKRLLLTLIIAHGTRIGETRKASWEYIDLTQKRWTIPAEDTKNGKPVVYPLTDGMVELLRSYQEWQAVQGYQTGMLFPLSKRSRKPIHSTTASTWVRDISKRKWSAHDLRKRARTIWLELGIDYIVCEALLNHARDKLDQVYIHTHMELQKKDALKTYHQWLNSCWHNWLLPISIPETTLH